MHITEMPTRNIFVNLYSAITDAYIKTLCKEIKEFGQFSLA